MEAGEADSQFQSIPAGLWWGLITLTTVSIHGIGDITLYKVVIQQLMTLFIKYKENDQLFQ